MAIVDTGLISRYYIDEAASGIAPTSLVDSSSNGYDLTTIDYGGGNLAFVEVSGNRGLVSSSITGTQRAVRAIDNTSDALRDALEGTQTATIEFVADLTAGNSGGGRIFGVNGRAGQNGECIMRFNTSSGGGLTPMWDDIARGLWIIGASSGRRVYHLVFDTTQATASNRVLIYVNGSVQAATSAGTTITQNSTLSLGSNLDLTMFNRENSGSYDRSIGGTIFYAAIYSSALSSTNVADNYAVLTADDDTPAGGGSVANAYYIQNN